MGEGHHMISKRSLLKDLRSSCGLARGELLVVHASVKAVGPVRGGVRALLDAILDVVGTTGAVLMPTFSHPTLDGVFDVRSTPSRTGWLTEALRVSAGATRSLHPTHSVVGWGERAPALLEGHDRTSGLGLDSPFHKAARAGAIVLMIGCDLRSCSLVHVAEAMVGVPYLGRISYPGYERTLTLVDLEGRRREIPPRDAPCDSAGFTMVQDELERRGLLRRCRLGRAETLRFAASDCLDVAAGLLRAAPAALLCHDPGCPVCPPARRIVDEEFRGRAHR